MTKQMTASPLYTRRSIMTLLVPLILEQILNVLVGTMDTLMVSSIGEEAVSAISLVDSVNFLLITLFAALATGGAVICSQYLGKGEPENAGESAKQLIWFSVLFAAAIGLFALLVNRHLLRLIFGKVSDGVMNNAVTYFYISALLYPFLALYNASAALFRSMNKSRVTLMIALLVNGMNIAGNALFIYVFQWGVAGAAWSTLIAWAAGGFILFSMLCRSHEQIRINEPFHYRPNKDMLRRILGIGIPTGAENSLFQLGKLLLSSLAATFGTAAISGHAIGGTLTGFSNIPGQAIGLGLITIVGQCMGAGQSDQAEYYTKKLVGWTMILMNAVDVVLYLTVPYLVKLYNLSPEGAQTAIKVVRSFCIAAIVIWPFAFTTPNTLRAAGDVKYTMAVSIGSMFLMRIVLAYVLAYHTDFGVLSIWYAMYADWAVRAVFYEIRFLRGKWKKIRLV